MGSTLFSWKKQKEKSKKEEDEHHKSADADLAETAAKTASTVDENPSNSALNPQASDTSKPSIDLHDIESYQHPIVFPPHMPPPIVHDGPVRVCIDMDTYIRTKPIDEESCFDWWTYNGGSPGPIIRIRLGDVLEIHFTNKDQTGMQHNIDFHAVEGPGGGSSLLTINQGQKKIALFKPLRAGLFLYHCAMAPAPVHLAQGMYGCVLVEPEGGLQPPAQREYCIVQAELYTSERIDEKEPIVYIGPDEEENREKIENELKGLSRLDMDIEAGVREKATYVLFNGMKGAEGYSFPEHTDTSIDLAKDALLAKPGDNIRIFFVNAGPNLVSSFHLIGGCWDRVWREADFVSAPAQAIQTTLVPAGGCAVVDFQPHVPGTYTMVDHSLFRIEKGAVKFIHVKGDPLSRPDLYASGSGHGLENCDACKLHPK
ncbi:unnamed protein product [Rotaria sordida]|uniref:Copper-containing nitrite reductase n=1 Tax=Rotaria sordida TaxID=392033 RepID=A0A814WFR1_9BILA|nr:unnamed protein product [Rotaria sordida]CAF1200821.1 unnamed protein product [Rotaria sordida]